VDDRLDHNPGRCRRLADPLRNYGFSDAAEFFVFISAICSAFIYAPIGASGQFLPAVKRL